MDLNVLCSSTDEQERSRVCYQAINFGWSGVAWATEVLANKNGIASSLAEAVASAKRTNLVVLNNELIKKQTHLANLKLMLAEDKVTAQHSGEKEEQNGKRNDTPEFHQYRRVTIEVGDVSEVLFIYFSANLCYFCLYNRSLSHTHLELETGPRSKCEYPTSSISVRRGRAQAVKCIILCYCM